MDNFLTLPLFWIIISLILVWEMIWKGIALWKTGRNNQIGWFLAIFIFNTAGILPIIYLAFFQNDQDTHSFENYSDRTN